VPSAEECIAIAHPNKNIQKRTLYRGNASNAQMRPAEEGVDHAARNGRSIDCHRQQFRFDRREFV